MSVGARKSKRMLPIVAILVLLALAVEFIIWSALEPDLFTAEFWAGNVTEMK